MLEVLQFMFKDFWHWLGGFFYLDIIAWAFVSLIHIVFNRKG
jgi:hypothetical protein